MGKHDNVTYLEVLKIMNLDELVDDAGEPIEVKDSDMGDAEYSYYNGFAIFQRDENELHINQYTQVYPDDSYRHYAIVMNDDELTVHDRDYLDVLDVIATFKSDNVQDVFDKFVSHKTITRDMEYKDKIIKQSKQWLRELEQGSANVERVNTLKALIHTYEISKEYY